MWEIDSALLEPVDFTRQTNRSVHLAEMQVLLLAARACSMKIVFETGCIPRSAVTDNCTGGIVLTLSSL